MGLLLWPAQSHHLFMLDGEDLVDHASAFTIAGANGKNSTIHCQFTHQLPGDQFGKTHTISDVGYSQYYASLIKLRQLSD